MLIVSESEIRKAFGENKQQNSTYLSYFRVHDIGVVLHVVLNAVFECSNATKTATMAGALRTSCLVNIQSGNP